MENTMQQVNLYIKKNEYHNMVVGSVSEKDLIQMQFYHTDIKLYKGLDNTIQFSIRDHDRKKVVLEDNQSLRFTMINKELQQKVVKELEEIDASVGKYKITLTKGELNDLDNGVFTSHVSIVTNIIGSTNETEELVYSGNEFYPFFSVSVEKNDMELIIPTYEKDQTDFNKESIRENDGVLKDKYTSSIISSNISSQHTFQMTYGEGFTGKVVIQGTLESDPSTSEADWSNVYEHTYTGEETITNPVLINLMYNCLYLRVVITVDKDKELSLKLAYRN